MKESIRPAPTSTAPPTQKPSLRSPARRPTVGRPEGTFSQARRLEKLKDLLESAPGGLELDVLAGSLHCSTRSIRRYLSELARDTELESIPVTPGGLHVWRIKPSERGRSVLVRRTQAYGLLAARPHFELFRGSAFFDELDLAMRQIQQIAQRPARAGGSVKGEIPSDQRLEDRFVFIPASARNYASQAEDVDRVLQAIAELRVLTFRRDAGREREKEKDRERDSAPTPRRVAVRPYAVIAHKGTFVVLLADGARARGPDDDVRVVPMHQLHDCAVTEERFVIPSDFEVADYLQGEFTPAPRIPRQRVVVEFDARVAEEVRSRRVHPQQKVAVAADGRIRLSFPLVSLEEVRTWVLGFGDAAHVVDPPELAAEIAAMLHRTLARYR